MKRFLLLLLIMLPVIMSGQSDTSDTLKHTLNQVTVTATRYPEQTMEVPYAITILNEDEMQNLRGYGLDEALILVPGVLAQSRAGNQDVRIIIRGFGARGAGDRSNSGTSRGIRIMMDGIPETEPDGRTSFDNIDLSLAKGLEVIRSNSSALWGNASGGIINISSVPDFSSPYVQFQTMIGGFGLSKYVVETGTVLGNGKLYGSFSKTIFDGWREHSSSDRGLFNAGFISNLSPVTTLGVYMVGASNIFHIPGPLTQAEYDADPRQANEIYQSRDERRYNRLGRIGVTLEHTIGIENHISGMLYINPKYLQRSERNTFRDFTRYHLGGNIIFNNYMDFSNFSNNLTLGMDEAYQDGAILFYSLSPTNGRGDELKDNKREGANTFGAFLQDEIIINDKFSLIAGARYDKVTYYSESFIESGYGLQSKVFEKVTPRGGLTYRINPTISVYANLGGGIEVPAGNETDPSGTFGLDSIYLLNPLLDPITSTTYEAGLKQLIYVDDISFLKYLTYDIAIYYIDITNDIIPYRGGRFYFTAGESNRKGIEAGINLVTNAGLSFNGSFTFSANEYDKYLVDSVHYDPDKAGIFADYSGNKAAGIPDYFYAAGLTYTFSSLNDLFLTFSVNGIGPYFVNDSNTLEVPSYNTLGLTVGFNNEIKLGDHIGLRGFLSIQNLTDEKYVGSAFINPDLNSDGEPIYLEPGLPRWITGSISLSFN